MSSLMVSEWGPNWQGCVNRQLAKELLHKRTHNKMVLYHFYLQKEIKKLKKECEKENKGMSLRVMSVM